MDWKIICDGDHECVLKSGKVPFRSEFVLRSEAEAAQAISDEAYKACMVDLRRAEAKLAEAKNAITSLNKDRAALAGALLDRERQIRALQAQLAAAKGQLEVQFRIHDEIVRQRDALQAQLAAARESTGHWDNDYHRLLDEKAELEDKLAEPREALEASAVSSTVNGLRTMGEIELDLFEASGNCTCKGLKEASRRIASLEASLKSAEASSKAYREDRDRLMAENAGLKALIETMAPDAASCKLTCSHADYLAYLWPDAEPSRPPAVPDNTPPPPFHCPECGGVLNHYKGCDSLRSKPMRSPVTPKKRKVGVLEAAQASGLPWIRAPKKRKRRSK